MRPQAKTLTKKGDPKQKKNPAWGRDLGSTFEFASKIHYYRLYRPFGILPRQIVYILGTLFAKAFVSRSHYMRKRLDLSFKLIFPKSKPKRLETLRNATINYMGQLLLEIMLRDPNIKPKHMDKFIHFKHLDRLDHALAQWKGVVLLSIHTCNFMHTLGALLMKRYPLTVVGNLQNIALFQNLMGREEFSTLHVIGTTKFENIKEEMENQLKSNRILFLMQDFSNSKQLMTPFWEGKYPFLYHSPQSGISLHRKFGSPIIPVISRPMGELGKSIIEFLNPTPISVIDSHSNTFESKEYHGRMSIAINRLFAPYLIGYAHVWEEILNFYNSRVGDQLNFPPKIELTPFFYGIQKKILDIIQISYEPTRKDDLLKAYLNTKFQRILDQVSNPHLIVRKFKIKIALSAMSGFEKIDKLIKISLRIARELALDEIVGEFTEMTQESPKFWVK